MSLSLRVADPVKDFDLILEGARAFATEYNRPDVIPSPTSQKFFDAIWDLVSNSHVKVLLAEDEQGLVGGLGYMTCQYIWDREKLHAEELFWWCKPGAPPTAAMRLLRMAFSEWRKAGVNLYALHSLTTSPESVDVVYQRLGASPAQATYVGVL
jgi:hypothetical protein